MESASFALGFGAPLLVIFFANWLINGRKKKPAKPMGPSCEFCGTEYRAKRVRYCHHCGKARPIEALTLPTLPPLTYPLSPAVPRGGIIVGPSQMGGYEHVPTRYPATWDSWPTNKIMISGPNDYGSMP